MHLLHHTAAEDFCPQLCLLRKRSPDIGSWALPEYMRQLRVSVIPPDVCLLKEQNLIFPFFGKGAEKNEAIKEAYFSNSKMCLLPPGAPRDQQCVRFPGSLFLSCPRDSKMMLLTGAPSSEWVTGVQHWAAGSRSVWETGNVPTAGRPCCAPAAHWHLRPKVRATKQGFNGASLFSFGQK